MTEAQRAAIAAIESQQPQKHNTVWMAGEQLKEIARSEPGSAELLAKDLAGKGMTIADAEKKIAELARKNRDGNCGCVSSEEAEDVLRAFYGLPQRESFAEEHHAEELSTRELEKLIRERDEARRAEQDAQEKAAAADKARAAAEELAKGAEDARRDALAAAERLKNAQAAEKDAKAAAKQAKAELKALRENPVIPAEVLEKLRAEETQRAAETAQQETARRVAEAEKAAQESARRAEQAERQLAAADPEVATFKAWFRAVQDDFARMQETHAQVTDPEKADKLRAAVRALLERERTVWG